LPVGSFGLVRSSDGMRCDIGLLNLANSAFPTDTPTPRDPTGGNGLTGKVPSFI